MDETIAQTANNDNRQMEKHRSKELEKITEK